MSKDFEVFLNFLLFTRRKKLVRVEVGGRGWRRRQVRVEVGGGVEEEGEEVKHTTEAIRVFINNPF